MIATTVCTGDNILDAAFRVDICDEGGGAFLEITDSNTGHGIRVDPDEWDELKECVEYLLTTLVKE